MKALQAPTRASQQPHLCRGSSALRVRGPTRALTCRAAGIPPASTVSAGPRASASGLFFSADLGQGASALLSALSTVLAPAITLAAARSAPALRLKAPNPLIASAEALLRPPALNLAVATAPSLTSSICPYPSDWLVVGSASQWFDLNRRACAEGKLLATVFISAKAAAAHGGTIERLRRAYAAGEGAQVQFVFVDVGASYGQRLQNCRTCRTASLARGRSALSVSRVSHTAAIHGLDVALSYLLPEGQLRACPTLMLTAGVLAADGATRLAAANRTPSITQLMANAAFVNAAFAQARERATAKHVSVAGVRVAEGSRAIRRPRVALPQGPRAPEVSRRAPVLVAA
ncbi:hypothetical protein HYH03_013502 [Edaphochlamys debaryana]|uniref:Uncharacterized protein n=1 Tax=Edaphochlamys debaryana TaxID=47281 RepID=A0A835XN37_9CHLO|nr:hypothetical protein HYH03_013502 [Edaphochlamys debaryana]|eukprot:KAG2487922.1 hypothetical protein HYH03_013502 [Edaphochlamys debaryana]